MIKCDVTLCAVISKAAMVKNGKDGSSFLSFLVKMMVNGRDGFQKELELSVTTDGDKNMASIFALGRRVKVKGVLSVVKRGGVTYYNVRATDPVEMVNSYDSDLLDGTMTFLGKLDPKKDIEVRTDKNGKTFKAFSAFSTDKNGDKAEFSWVRFLYFDPKDGEEFLQKGAHIEVKGDLQISAYQKTVEGGVRSGISLECRAKEVSRWVLTPRDSQ